MSALRAQAERGAGLYAISDLHVDHAENRELIQQLCPNSKRDWLIVAGDVADDHTRFEWALRLLSERFEQVVWVPGNHELLTYKDDPLQLRGEQRYRHLVELCREIGVLTPEDPFARWDGPGGPVLVAPLFLLYDYSFGRNVAPDKAEAMRLAHGAGVVCVDEYLLHPDPFPSREAWCEARVAETERQLAAADPALSMVLVNHFPLTAEPTRVLRHPEFAQWCGTSLTADWHRRFRATAVVYGHLHIPRTSWQDGVRFEEVSIGYPRERARRLAWRPEPRRILPEAGRA
jgi:3',5'-cyclic AMP phosphodiesterase CpdA